MIINDFVIFAAVNYVTIAVLAIVCIAVIVLSVLAFQKRWHWSNMVFLILTTIASVFVITGMTTVFHQRSTAMKQYDQVSENLANAERSLEEMISGGVAGTRSLQEVEAELSRLMLGRGRSWSGGSVAANGEQLTYTFNAPREMPGADDPNPGLILLKDFQVYAFLESRDRNVPAEFVGKFRVSAETAESLTLEPMMIVRADALAKVGDDEWFSAGGPDFTDLLTKNAGRKWTIYEKMPQDSREIFRDEIVSVGRQALARKDAQQPKQGDEDFIKMAENINQVRQGADVKFDISTFRKLLRTRYLRADNLGYDPASAEYEELLDSYAFDQLRLGEINNWIEANPDGRIVTTFDPPPEERFVIFRFNADTDKDKNPAISTDGTGRVEVDGLFNTNGQAVVPEIKLNQDVEFKASEEILVDSDSADGYNRDNETEVPAFDDRRDAAGKAAVTRVGERFFRRLRDYTYEFRNINLEGSNIHKRIAEIEQGNDDRTRINRVVDDQTGERTRLLDEAEADKKALANDLATIIAAVEARQKEIDQLNQTITQLKGEIASSYKQIRETMLKLSQQAFASR